MSAGHGRIFDDRDRRVFVAQDLVAEGARLQQVFRVDGLSQGRNREPARLNAAVARAVVLRNCLRVWVTKVCPVKWVSGTASAPCLFQCLMCPFGHAGVNKAYQMWQERGGKID